MHLKVMMVDVERNLIAVRGSVPGANGGIVYIKQAARDKRAEDHGFKVAVKNLKGEQVNEIDLPESIFGAPVDVPLMHQALLRQLANAHLGTHDTQTRSEVSQHHQKS